MKNPLYQGMQSALWLYIGVCALIMFGYGITIAVQAENNGHLGFGLLWCLVAGMVLRWTYRYFHRLLR